MTTCEKVGLDVLLFGTDGEVLEDIKCYRGDRADVTAEDIRSEIHSAFVQHQAHPELASRTAPAASSTQVDVREFVKKLKIAA